MRRRASETRCVVRSGPRPSSASTRARQPRGGGTGKRSGMASPDGTTPAIGGKLSSTLPPSGGPPSRPRPRTGCAGRPPCADSHAAPAEVRADVPTSEAEVAEVAPLHDVDDLVADEAGPISRARAHAHGRPDRDAFGTAGHRPPDPEAIPGPPLDRHASEEASGERLAVARGPRVVGAHHLE